MAPVISLNLVDYAIIAGYILVMVLVGYSLKKYMKTGEDFFLSGRSLPPWITGLAFLSANLGALEIIGMVANSAKYGIATVHFYWVGAIPAMVFLGIFMMPFYYGSRVRTVPEYLKLRYNEATRGLMEGVALTHKQLTDTLRRFAVEAVDPKGQPFNPELHQAVSMQPAEGMAANTVTAVLAKGYTLNGRLLHPAMVVVAAG